MSEFEFGYEVKEQAVPLKNYAFHLTQNHEDANDLLQETMLKALNNREKFQADTNLKGWLYTIMKNTFINNYRRMVKRNTFTDTSENSFFLNSVYNSELNTAETTVALEDIQNEIEKLPKDLKNSFMMNFRGFKYQEIADHYGIPIGTVKTRIHLARQILKKRLHVYGQQFGFAMN
jgi:RNA polymerase sigma factor (sigma-70 family)